MQKLQYLSLEQKEAYEHDGFLVLPNVVSSSICQQLIERADQLVKTLQPEWDQAIFTTHNQEQATNNYFLNSGDKIRVFMEEGEESVAGQHRVNKLGHALHDLDPVFQAFSHQEFLSDIASDLGLDHTGLLQSMYIFKQPHIGGEVNIHQDATFLYTHPISVTGFWFALQDATLENGCLWALPGGHTRGLKERFYRTGTTTAFEKYDESPWTKEGFIPLEVPEGSLILLHGLLPHYSEANRSENPRQAYTLHVIDQQANYPGDNWLQRSQKMPLRSF